MAGQVFISVFVLFLYLFITDVHKLDIKYDSSISETNCSSGPEALY